MIDFSKHFEKIDFKSWQKLVQESAKSENELNFHNLEGVDLGIDFHPTFEINLSTYPKTQDLLKEDEIRELGEDLFQIKEMKAKASVFLETIHNAGASIVQEIHYALECLVLAKEKSIKHLNFIIAVDSLYFNNIAKLRALRFLIEALNNQYNLIDSFELIGINSLREQTLYDPWSNMLRNTFSTMAMLNGGADKIVTFSYNKLQSESNEFDLGRQHADNIYYVLTCESFLGKVKDPAKGSEVIDALTYEYASLSLNKFKEKQEKGGLFNDLESFSKDVLEVANQREQHILTRSKIISGINSFTQVDDLLENYPSNHLAKKDFPLRRPSESLERLRFELKDKELKLGLYTHENQKQTLQRANFAKDFIEVSGKDVLTLEDISQINDSFDLILLAASDDDYEELISKINFKDMNSLYIVSKKEIPGAKSLFIGKNIMDVLAPLNKEQK